MEITFWGVRGSIPAPGAEFNRYGGNTACISLRTAAGRHLFLDAGTGIVVLGRALMQRELGTALTAVPPGVNPPGLNVSAFARGDGQATILLTHSHWDHIQGFPFFAPVYVPGNRLTIYGPSESPGMVEGILEGQMDPHFSPVQSLRNLGAEIEFRAAPEGQRLEIDGLTVIGRANPHGRRSALAYRLEEPGGGIVVYAPDAGYPGGLPAPEVEELYQGASYLIHDTTYTPEDQIARRARGQSSIADAARVAARCGVRTLVMFHYDQDYTDLQVDALERRCRALLDDEPGGREVELVAAREGLTLASQG